jgi:PAS domain S-box-containing protein
VAFLESIVENMAAGLLIIDHQGKIVGVNRKLESMTGYRREELLGRSCAVFQGDTCMGRDDEGFLSRCQLFQSGEIEQKRCTIRHREGHRLHIVKDGAILRDGQGRPRVGVELLTDIATWLNGKGRWPG